MKEASKTIICLQNFVNEINSIESKKYYRDKLIPLIKFCEQCRLSNIPEVNVISTSILEILNEIYEYLNYYEENIEKSFAGANTMEEWNRIDQSVIRPFIDNLKIESKIDNYEKRLEVINNLIANWCCFEQEDLNKIL